MEDSVDRPRLRRGLGTGTPWASQAPDVLLVCAPAGYGKTTFLAELCEDLRAAAVPVAWVTCGRDDDGHAFWSAVLVAVAGSVGEGAAALASLRPPSAPADPAFVSRLLEAVREEAPGLVLVLDDAHEVKNPELLALIGALVEGADGNLRVALGCRFEPPVGLYRLRLSGRLHEVRAAQLAFTPDEADRLWDGRGLTLDLETRRALHALTEGWPAGLRLASLSLEAGADPAEFVERFSGADQPVADYLAREVLGRMPEDVMTFLMSTCVVEEVPVDLAVRLSGCADAATRLEDLARRHALVMRLDRQGTWFRYHALLRTYFAAALQRRDPNEYARLHGDAAEWFLTQGRPADALEHASLAGDTARVERILRGQGLLLLLAGSGMSVRRAIGMLPATARAAPAVLVHRALLAVDEGDILEADEVLAALSLVPDDGTDPRMTSLRQAAVLHRARLAADLAAADASQLIAGVGPSYLPAGLDADVRLLVLGDRGALRLFEGDFQGAREDLLRAVELARATELHGIQMYCKNLVAGTYIAQNDFARAHLAAEKAIAFSAARGWARSPTLAYSYAQSAWTSFQMLRPAQAARRAATAIDVIDTTVDVDGEVEGAARTTEAIIAFDDPTRRRAALDRLDQVTTWLTKRGASPALTAIPALHELRMCLTLGESQRAQQAVDRAAHRLGHTGEVAVLRAQLAAARGLPMDARRLLKPVLRGDLVPLRSTTLTSAWLLEAVGAHRSDRRPAATDALLAALRVAAPTGATRPFFDAGAEAHAMLADHRGRAGHLESFLDTVLNGIADALEWQQAALSTGSSNHQSHPTTSEAAEFTKRELDVLHDLPSMMTLSEIATARGITLNTVKTHVRSIYAKLGAQNRREAISTARGLGLL